MLQRVAECCRVVQRVAVCCSALQCVAVCCSVPQSALYSYLWKNATGIDRHHINELQRVAASCSVLQCVAVRCFVTHICGRTVQVSIGIVSMRKDDAERETKLFEKHLLSLGGGPQPHPGVSFLPVPLLHFSPCPYFFSSSSSLSLVASALCIVSATHCNTMQHAATQCNTLQHTATHFSCIFFWHCVCNTL